jgi:hypothetical protein
MTAEPLRGLGGADTRGRTLARCLQWVAWVLAAVLAARLGRFIVRSVEGNAYDFASYYTAARLTWHTAPGEYFYNAAWFAARGLTYTGLAASGFDPNPPTTALLLVPLVGFQYTTARLVWALVTVVCLAAAVGMLAKGLGLRGDVLAGFSAFVLVYQPLYADIGAGQVYVFLLALLVLGWAAYRRRADATLGLTLGCLAALKSAATPLWVLLLAQCRWKAFGWAAATVLALGLSSVALLGLQAWRTLNPDPLFPAPALGAWILGPALVAMTLISCSVTRGSSPSDLSFTVFATTSTIVNPLSLDYHYVPLLLPIAILLAWARNQPRPLAPILVGLAMFLIAADLTPRTLEMGRGTLALLNYPKLYGAMILWATAVYACHQHRRVTEHAFRPADSS